MAELHAWQIGPVLRGLSACMTERDTVVGPGALYRYGKVSTPDFTVTEPATVESITAQWHSYVDQMGVAPLTVGLPDGTAWSVVDGGGHPDTDDENQVLSPREIAESLRGRVSVVTGAAQGFGWEIARGLAALGAVVVLADINEGGVREAAEKLGVPHGGFVVDVTSEESVARLIREVTENYGGIDLLVSNAGVLKAGSVKTLEVKDFRFVTDVNYIGFFLMTKHAAPVMELQNQAVRHYVAGYGEGGSVVEPTNEPARNGRRQYLTDIVEINSKSGLVGSNRNAAYAGSKFGGIGLVQSFALELVEQGTKVNAVCPGNFLDGPLWSDPERGLFVQYLNAGKVPGAKTVADVRRFYESKVPMGRGCTGRDVVRAIAYLVGQEYETGQALPVTGGQVMLS